MRQVRRPGQPLTESAADYQSKATKTGPSWRGRGKATLYGLVVVLIAIVGWLAGQIRQVEIKNSRQPDQVAALVREEIASPFWYRHLFWLPTQELTERLLEANPDLLAKVKIEKEWLRRALVVEVEERQGVLAWQTNAAVYGVDQKGVVVNQPGREVVAGLPLVIDRSNLEVEIGQAIVPAGFVEFTLEVAANLPRETNLAYQQGRLIDTSNELYVDTNQGFYLRFDTTRPVPEQLSALKALLDKGITPTQYVDLRIPHKLYYR